MEDSEVAIIKLSDSIGWSSIREVDKGRALKICRSIEYTWKELEESWRICWYKKWSINKVLWYM